MKMILILQEGAKIIEFLDMSHGWTVRGDLTQENVKKDVEKALTEATEFFKQNLK